MNDHHISLEEMRLRRERRKREAQKIRRRAERRAKVVLVAGVAWILFWTLLIMVGAFLAVRWLWLETM